MPAADSLIDLQMHALYSHHGGWLTGWLRRRLGDAHQAGDLAHDTFLRILIACRRQEVALDDLREPRAYLTTVAGRLLLNHYRRLSLEQAWLSAMASAPGPMAPAPEERLVILETLHAIDALLDALPPRVRTAFLLSQLEGLTYAQIARQLGVTARSVKRYMAQAFEECLMHVS